MQEHNSLTPEMVELIDPLFDVIMKPETLEGHSEILPLLETAKNNEKIRSIVLQ